MNTEIKFKQNEITIETLKTVKNVIAKDATDEELKLYALHCNRTGLDPFTGQIHFIKRAGKPTFQTGIDGFRVVAERSKQYEGQTKVEWCGEDGIWRDIWLLDKAPVAARVGIYRRGFKEPLYAVAKYKSYSVSTNPLWAKMPDNQLAKCAEALALRKAFPNDLSGLYTDEEMSQADTKPATEVKEATVVEDNDGQSSANKDVAVYKPKVVITPVKTTYIDVKSQIEKATKRAELVTIFEQNRHLKGNKEFETALEKRQGEIKEEMTNLGKVPVPTSSNLPKSNEVIEDIDKVAEVIEGEFSDKRTETDLKIEFIKSAGDLIALRKRDTSIMMQHRQIWESPEYKKAHAETKAKLLSSTK